MAPVEGEGVRAVTQDLSSRARSARESFGAKAVLIVVRPRHGGFVVGADGLLGEDRERIRAALDPLASTLAEDDATQVDLTTDASLAQRFPWQARGLEAALSAPLRWERNEVGVIHVFDPDPARLGDDNAQLLVAARQIALAIAYEQLRSEATRLSSELESVVLLDQVVMEARTIDEMGHLLTERLAAVLGAATGGVMVYDEERGVLQTLPGAFGVSDDEAVSYRIKVDNPDSNSARVFTSGRPAVSNEPYGDPAIIQDYVSLFHVDRLLSLPLRLGGRKVGVLHLANKPTPFTAYDVDRAEMLAPRIATVVQLGTAMVQMRRQQYATEVMVEASFGISMGRDVDDLLGDLLERLGDVIETSILAVVSPGASRVVWSRPDVSERLVDDLLREAAGSAPPRPRIREPRQAGDPGNATHLEPVMLAGKRIGTLAALRRRADPFIDSDTKVLRRMASLIAVGWAAERYRRQQNEVATLRERQRIADDLHDTVAQLMYAAQLKIDSVLEDEDVGGEPALEMQRARSLLLKGDTAIREVIHQLAEPSTADLSRRLELMVGELQAEYQAAIRLEVPEPVALAAKDLDRATSETLLKTAREAAVNAIKHAGPCTISVGLGISRRNRLVLTVTDDGCGRAPAPSRNGNGNGHGLSSLRRALRERGGQLRVYSGERDGTRVMASVSL